MNEINVQTVIYGENVMYFAQNMGKVNYLYRGFNNLDELQDYISDKALHIKDLAPFAFKWNMAFENECAMCKWINSLCDNDSDLQEIFLS